MKPDRIEEEVQSGTNRSEEGHDLNILMGIQVRNKSFCNPGYRNMEGKEAEEDTDEEEDHHPYDHLFQPLIAAFPEEKEDHGEGCNRNQLYRNIEGEQVIEEMRCDDEETTICKHLEDIDDRDESDFPVPWSRN